MGLARKLSEVIDPIYLVILFFIVTVLVLVGVLLFLHRVWKLLGKIALSTELTVKHTKGTKDVLKTSGGLPPVYHNIDADRYWEPVPNEITGQSFEHRSRVMRVRSPATRDLSRGSVEDMDATQQLQRR